MRAGQLRASDCDLLVSSQYLDQNARSFPIAVERISLRFLEDLYYKVVARTRYEPKRHG